MSKRRFLIEFTPLAGVMRILPAIALLLMVSSAIAQSVPFDPQIVQQTAADALAQGDPEKGLLVFGSRTTACISCHRIGRHGGTIGPDLSRIGRDRTPQQIAESILFPARQVEDKYKSIDDSRGSERCDSPDVPAGS